MKVIFLKEFSKDLDGISLKFVKLSLKRVIERMETTEVLSMIPNTKKLQGHKTAYSSSSTRHRFRTTCDFIVGTTCPTKSYLLCEGVYVLPIRLLPLMLVVQC